MNRRIPNGTYGGVGGRKLITSSYPIEGALDYLKPTPCPESGMQ